MSIPVKTRTDICIRTMLEEHAAFLYCNGEKYYFLSFWFKANNEDDPWEFEMFHLDHLPEELKKAITLIREHPENFISIEVK